MKFYIEVEDSVAVGKGTTFDNATLNKNQISIDKELYYSIKVPSMFEINKGGDLTNFVFVGLEPEYVEEVLIEESNEFVLLQQKVAEQDLVIEELMFEIIPSLLGGM